MPQIFFDPVGGLNSFVRQMPIPTLNSYIMLSILLTVGSVYYVHNLFTDKEFNELIQEEIRNETVGRFKEFGEAVASSLTCRQLYYAVNHPTLVWVLVNTVCAVLAILGKIAVYFTFGSLRMQESTMLRDRLCSFVLYKAVFLFGVLNSVLLEELIAWILWFALVSTITLLQIITFHRFKYFTSSVSSRRARLRILSLSAFSLVASGALAVFALSSFSFLSISYALFILADASKLLFRGFYLTTKSALVVEEILAIFPSVNPVSVAYYLDLIHDLITDAVDLLHYTHMLLYSQIVLSMACIVLSMQLRSFYKSLTSRINRHLKYQRISAHISQNYPEATREELESMEDWCAICWESMQSARRLPCNHFFHEWCLRGWLEQDSSCPTCRLGLSPASNASATNQPSPSPPNVQPFSHVFHFDGGRYARFLPSFSFEFSHSVGPIGPHLFQRNRAPEFDNSQLNSMAEQVREMFPQLDIGTILEDIRETGSAQATIENILEGRLVSRSLSTQFERPALEEDIWENPGPSSVGGRRPPTQPSSPQVEASFSVPSTGSRFSAHSEERHSMLSHRKAALIELHRRRYIASPRGADLRAQFPNEMQEPPSVPVSALRNRNRPE